MGKEAHDGCLARLPRSLSGGWASGLPCYLHPGRLRKWPPAHVSTAYGEPHWEETSTILISKSSTIAWLMMKDVNINKRRRFARPLKTGTRWTLCVRFVNDVRQDYGERRMGRFSVPAWTTSRGSASEFKRCFDRSPIFGLALSDPRYSITSEPIPNAIFMLAREDGVLPSRIDFQYNSPERISRYAEQKRAVSCYLKWRLRKCISHYLKKPLKVCWP